MTDNSIRPDVDIEEEISALVRTFAPLSASRNYFKYQAYDGLVKLVGNLRTPQARRFLLDNIPRIHGVTGIDASNLYDDEEVLFGVAQLLPPGVIASVHYGTVALNGNMPQGSSLDTVTAAVSRVPGVQRVGAYFA